MDGDGVLSSRPGVEFCSAVPADSSELSRATDSAKRPSNMCSVDATRFNKFKISRYEAELRTDVEWRTFGSDGDDERDLLRPAIDPTLELRVGHRLSAACPASWTLDSGGQ